MNKPGLPLGAWRGVVFVLGMGYLTWYMIYYVVGFSEAIATALVVILSWIKGNLDAHETNRRKGSNN